MIFFSKKKSNTNRIRREAVVLLIASSVMLLSCEESSNARTTSFRTDLNLPESLTGPNANSVAASTHVLSENKMARGVESFSITAQAKEENLFQCQYLGPEDDDIFKNGYNMTKFMTSAVATWSCIGDSLIYISSVLPHDNKVRKTEHDGAAPDYDPEEPSHYKISDGEDGKVEVALYYGFSHAEDLPNDAVIGFYFAWREQADRTIGRMIIDADAVNNPADDEDDPVKVRMDFDYDSDVKKADMYMVFDEGNEWASGFRIQVKKDLTAANDEKVFTAIGKIDMTAQFLPASGITEVPVFDVYTVSNAAGNGAARAEFSDLSLPIEINVTNHLGNYLADKVDIYFFDEDSDWNWIEKTFQNSVYKSGRSLSDITLENVETYVGLTDYFETECLAVDDDCDDLINKIFSDGFYGQEENQGSDPEDWRSVGISNASTRYLDSVFPEGNEDWEGVFDPTF